jgi:LysM repeat protein
MKFSMKLFLLMAVTAGFAAGCAGQKRIQGSQVPTTPVNTQASATSSTLNPNTYYTVVSGNTLWGISGSSKGYNNPLEWPLIFRANRDKIQDPDLIYPHQIFEINHNYSTADVAKAKLDAALTPKYVPHTRPRKTLPINYF